MHRRNLFLLGSLLFAFEASSSYVYAGLTAALYCVGVVSTYRAFKQQDSGHVKTGQEISGQATNAQPQSPVLSYHHQKNSSLK